MMSRFRSWYTRAVSDRPSLRCSWSGIAALVPRHSPASRGGAGLRCRDVVCTVLRDISTATRPASVGGAVRVLVLGSEPPALGIAAVAARAGHTVTLWPDASPAPAVDALERAGEI